MIFDNNNISIIIPMDIWRYISQWLSDIQRFHLMITSKEMMELNLLFDEEHLHFRVKILS